MTTRHKRLKTWAFRVDPWSRKCRPALSLIGHHGFMVLVWTAGDDMLGESARDAHLLARCMRTYLESKGWTA